MRLLYVLLSHVFFVLASPFLLTHPKLRQGIRERLGWYGRDWPGVRPGPRIWVHGASAGDILALLPTVRHLREKRPNVQCIATTVTNSGRVVLEQERDIFAARAYLPYDLPGPVNRALRAIRPDLIVLEYTELWPNLIHAAKRRGIPIVLHNGRLSAAQLGRYRWLFRVVGNLLAKMDLLLMRHEHEVERAVALGADPQRVIMAGNTKFDRVIEPPPGEAIKALRRSAGLSEDAMVWVAGSTHEGEEEILIKIFAALRANFPDLHMIIAPRYTERAERVVHIAERHGLRSRRRSSPGEKVDVLVLDTIGELLACYATASLVFVGGSFVTRGGQNILEPAACGKPVLFGPHMHNFEDALQVLLGRGGVQVASPAQLERVMGELLKRPDERRELGELARHQARSIRGVAKRNAETISSLLTTRGRKPAPRRRRRARQRLRRAG